MAWSYSSLSAFETCARQYHEVRVLKKYPFEKNEQAIYGDELHKAAELFVEHNTSLPPQFSFIQPLITALLARPGQAYAEKQYALTTAMEPCSWWDKKVWVRGKADLLVLDKPRKLAWVVDYKTGSDKYADKDQLDLLSAMIFEHEPEVDTVKSALAFVAKNNFIKHTRHRADKDKLWQSYRERVAKIDGALSSGVWNPSQSGLCYKHCPVLECEFNGRR